MNKTRGRSYAFTADGGSSRDTWGSQVEFVLTLIGFAVGLGNVWRFPYLCYKNGGGAFLIPYFVCLFIVGIPLFYLEICLGQYARLGPLKIWRANPAFKGLGFAMVIVTAFIALYYCVIIAWCLYFFFASMSSSLPWSSCNNAWNTCACRHGIYNKSQIGIWNGTRPECANVSLEAQAITTPSEDFWKNNVLNISGSLEESGGVKWDLALCLLLAWTVTFCVLCKGVQSLGKVVYVTAIFPYILLTVLLVRGLTLEGSEEGIRYYLTPTFEKITDPNVWADAAAQIFFSLSSCQGGLLAMASYNKFNNNLLRDTFLIPIINCLTSFYGGFTIFSVLGFMAKSKGVSVDKVAEEGPGLAFVVYPEGLAQMPIAPFWSCVFFLMMFTLGFSSIFGLTETVMTGIMDEIVGVLKTKWHTVGFRFMICMTGFLLGLPMVTRGGFYLFDIVDKSVGGFPLLFTGLFEIISIIYIYGFYRFKGDIEMMLGRNLPVQISFIYFGITWCFLSPVCLTVLIALKAVKYEPSEGISQLGSTLGWLIVVFPLICIPVWFVYYFCRNGLFKLCRELTSPEDNWGPASMEHTIIVKKVNSKGTEIPEDKSDDECKCIAYENKGYESVGNTHNVIVIPGAKIVETSTKF